MIKINNFSTLNFMLFYLNVTQNTKYSEKYQLEKSII